MKKVFQGIGHGGNDPGAAAFGLVEKDINLVIGLAMSRDLAATGVIETKLSRYKDENDDLNEEIRECNQYDPDLAIDIHTNAGGGDGFEVFYSNGSTSGLKFAKLIEEEVKAIGQNSRGIKIKLTALGRDYFGFVRETKAPAIIVECGFLDSEDRFIFDTKEEQELFGKAYARAVLRYFGYDPDLINGNNNSVPTVERPTNTRRKTNLYNGAYDSLILRLQKALNKEDIADKYGRRLVENGWLGECTLSAAQKYVVYKGRNSEVVLCLQYLLTYLGYDVKGLDSNCGPGMDAAINFYQSDWGLERDRLFGPNCWKAILGM